MIARPLRYLRRLRLAKRLEWRWQRAQRGYSQSDCWSFDTYLAGVIAGGCETLRACGHGHPPGMTAPDWDGILAAIAEPLREYSEKKFACATTQEELDLLVRAQAALDLFSKHFANLWD